MIKFNNNIQIKKKEVTHIQASFYVIEVTKSSSIFLTESIPKKIFVRVPLEKKKKHHKHINMETINKFLPFGLKAQNLIPFFITAKLISFAGFTIFMMNR